MRSAQALNCFDGLKEAWSARKMEVEARIRVMGGQGLFGGSGGYSGYGNYGANAYSSGQELNRLEQVRACLHRMLASRSLPYRVAGERVRTERRYVHVLRVWLERYD